MSDTIIKAESLCFTYEDGTEALKGIDLEIGRGRKVAFLGANGSGKSTFFFCLNGIHRPLSGQLYFDGEPYDYSKQGLLKIRSKVGIVFQDPDSQLFSASVYQEISFGAMNLGLPVDEVQSRVEQAIQDLEITPFRDKPTHFLSGGQKKQVSIADILVMNPDVIVLDEPAAALDPKHTVIVNHLIDKLSERGITTIISTHDVNHAYDWADDVVLFLDGRVLLSGSPEEVFSDDEALYKTNLEKPAALRLFEDLCQKGILDHSLPLPRTLETLEEYIQQSSVVRKGF
ncbi:MAG TPA: ATP-binding cassette domain-containing protein [Firmicutes bacterium]|nr:ATP-binding cassette domain-containing protein [Bacillota bacterium]